MLPLVSGREVQLDFLQDCKAGDVQAQGMKEVVMTALCVLVPAGRGTHGTQKLWVLCDSLCVVQNIVLDYI